MLSDRTTPADTELSYWALAGARVRAVVAASPAAAGHLADVAIAQDQPAAALDLARRGGTP